MGATRRKTLESIEDSYKTPTSSKFQTEGVAHEEARSTRSWPRGLKIDVTVDDTPHSASSHRSPLTRD